MNKVAYFVALNRKYFDQDRPDRRLHCVRLGKRGAAKSLGGNAEVVEGAFEHTLRMQTKGSTSPVSSPMAAMRATSSW